jgi:hypothetical protein
VSRNGDAKRAWVNGNVIRACFADGFDEAIIGISERAERDPVVAYDRDRCIEILMERHGKNYDEALEFFDFKILGAWVGYRTPEFISLYDQHPPLRIGMPTLDPRNIQDAYRVDESIDIEPWMVYED